MNSETKEVQYHLAWSNECIEYWFLLHFTYYVSNNHRKEYIKFLNEKLSDQKSGKYAKNMENIFDLLLEKGDPKRAIKYAKNILNEHDRRETPSMIAPGTKVHELVEELAKYLPEEIKGRFLEQD